jgi:hypothetical protein
MFNYVIKTDDLETASVAAATIAEEFDCETEIQFADGEYSVVCEVTEENYESFQNLTENLDGEIMEDVEEILNDLMEMNPYHNKKGNFVSKAGLAGGGSSGVGDQQYQVKGRKKNKSGGVVVVLGKKYKGGDDVCGRKARDLGKDAKCHKGESAGKPPKGMKKLKSIIKGSKK